MKTYRDRRKPNGGALDFFNGLPMTPLTTFRGRIFLVLFFVALIPATLTLMAGTFVLREVVLSTGTAGAWDQVAQSGRGLLDEVERLEDSSPALIAAAESHREELAESVRFSRLYAFLGERVLFLLPISALVLLGLVGGLALVTANWFSKSFSRPIEELVAWTRVLGTGQELPPPNPEQEAGELSEIVSLRDALRSASLELMEAREREVERVRMESWSEMARRVAHEIKNPLTPMRMAAERVARTSDPQMAHAGQVLQEEILRLDSLARTFAHFGHPPEGPMSPVDLIELLSGISRRLSTEESPVRLDAPGGRVEVMGYLDALERVVQNLVANAQEADLSHDGQDGRTHAGVDIVVRTSEAGVQMSFLDRGPGIPAELLPIIWEPEFTTKRRGTGLGLSMVRQAVRAHGGRVSALNREGGGAEFRVILPLGKSTRDVGSRPEGTDDRDTESVEP